MLIQTQKLMMKARQDGFAIGAFNVYNLEGALAVIQAAQELNSPVILQVLPSALEIAGSPLIALCLEAGKSSTIPVAVHLDHCPSEKQILFALEAGISSVMADGSSLEYEGNLEFTRKIVKSTKKYSAGVEAELGRIGGSEDGLPEETLKAKMTDPVQAADFADQTGVCALAVCIGNIHGKYKTQPQLDFERLEVIKKLTPIPLVLHGTSGLPDWMIEKAIGHGVCKFNVNTEIRTTYLNTLNTLFQAKKKPELVHVMEECIHAMAEPIKEKIRLFGSSGRAV